MQPYICTCAVLFTTQARDVFGVENMAGLCGAYGVGHVRYPTSGCNSVEEAQVDRISGTPELLESDRLSRSNCCRLCVFDVVWGVEDVALQGELSRLFDGTKKWNVDTLILVCETTKPGQSARCCSVRCLS